MSYLTGTLVVLHVVAAVVGFGAVVATGVLARAARRDPAAAAVVRYFRPAPNWASYSLLLVPVFGAGLEASSRWPDVHLLWPWLALAIWTVAAAAGAFVHWPAERALQRLVAAPAGGAAGALDRVCRRAAWSSAVMAAAFFAALVVMLVQPA